VEDKRKTTLATKVSEEEAEKIKQIAEAKGITVSDLIRRSVLNLSIPERISPEKLKKKNKAIRQLAYEVNKLGINLNQIAKYCNKHREVDALVLEEIIAIERKLTELLETAYRSLTD
jgi:DNA-binding LacI/PurR family transcriptional regulator